MFITALVLVLRVKSAQSRPLKSALWAINIISATFLQVRIPRAQFPSYSNIPSLDGTLKKWCLCFRKPGPAGRLALGPRKLALEKREPPATPVSLQSQFFLPITKWILHSIHPSTAILGKNNFVRLVYLSNWPSCWLSLAALRTVFVITQRIVSGQPTWNLANWGLLRDLAFVLCDFTRYSNSFSLVL